MAKVRKTAPCPCGSGKKYKYCHGATEQPVGPEPPPRRHVFLWIILALAPIAYAASLYQGDPTATTVERVWSEEHGHYHNIDGSELGAAAKAKETPATPGKTPGAAPPGKIWSEEHGHWHDDGTQPEAHDYVPPTDALKAEPYRLERPDGPPPEGKTWSEAHGHWHDNDSP